MGLKSAIIYDDWYWGGHFHKSCMREQSLKTLPSSLNMEAGFNSRVPKYEVPHASKNSLENDSHGFLFARLLGIPILRVCSFTRTEQSLLTEVFGSHPMLAYITVS